MGLRREILEWRVRFIVFVENENAFILIEFDDQIINTVFRKQRTFTVNSLSQTSLFENLSEE